MPEAELLEVVQAVGFHDVRITEHFGCYDGTSAKEKLSDDLNVHGVNLFARKPS